jgi:hypothetical protein
MEAATITNSGPIEKKKQVERRANPQQPARAPEPTV